MEINGNHLLPRMLEKVHLVFYNTVCMFSKWTKTCKNKFRLNNISLILAQPDRRGAKNGIDSWARQLLVLS